MNKLIIFCLALAICLILMGCNGHNSIAATLSETQVGFVDTGVRVKNHQDRVYSIVKDANGFLYYCSDVEGTLAPVYNEYGLPTKDTDMFD